MLYIHKISLPLSIHFPHNHCVSLKVLSYFLEDGSITSVQPFVALPAFCLHQLCLVAASKSEFTLSKIPTTPGTLSISFKRQSSIDTAINTFLFQRISLTCGRRIFINEVSDRCERGCLLGIFRLFFSPLWTLLSFLWMMLSQKWTKIFHKKKCCIFLLNSQTWLLNILDECVKAVIVLHITIYTAHGYGKIRCSNSRGKDTPKTDR